MYLPPKLPQYSTPVNTMASVIHRLNPSFTVHYCEFLLSHMSTPSFHYLGNLSLVRLAELVRVSDAPPAWVPKSFLDEMADLANSYRGGR